MELEQALAIANQLVFRHSGKHLSDLEQIIFTGAWQHQTYEQIAEAHGYSVKYLKDDSGRKFWKLLTQAFGEPVSKSNFRAAIERQQEKSEAKQKAEDAAIQQSSPSPQPFLSLSPHPPISPSPQID